jgi:hypothetical protein
MLSSSTGSSYVQLFVFGCTLYPTADGMTKSLSRSMLMWRRAVAASYAVHYDLCVIYLAISALVTRVDSGHLGQLVHDIMIRNLQYIDRWDN